MKLFQWSISLYKQYQKYIFWLMVRQKLTLQIENFTRELVFQMRPCQLSSGYRQIIDCKKFAIAVLALNKKAFVIYIAYLGSKMSIYVACKSQMALLQSKKISFLKKYTEFLDVFSKQTMKVLPNFFDIKKKTINLEQDK